MPSDRKKFLFAGILASAATLAAWQGLSLAIGKAIILPGPHAVITRFLELSLTPRFWQSVLATTGRGMAGFLLAAVPGTVLGFFSGRSDLFRASVNPLLTVLKSTPVLSVILIALIWFGSDFVPVFAAFLMALPIVTAAVEEGVRTVDKRLLEMAGIFSFSRKRIVRAIYFPHALPFFVAGAGSALSLTWKVIISAEVLSQPARAIGTGMQAARIAIETTDVFAWTLAAVLLCATTDSIFRAIVRRLEA